MPTDEKVRTMPVYLEFPLEICEKIHFIYPDYVNFTASLEYSKSTSTKHALLILSKDNPSDNPEFDQSIFIPVILK